MHSTAFSIGMVPPLNLNKCANINSMCRPFIDLTLAVLFKYLTLLRPPESGTSIVLDQDHINQGIFILFVLRANILNIQI